MWSTDSRASSFSAGPWEKNWKLPATDWKVFGFNVQMAGSLFYGTHPPKKKKWSNPLPFSAIHLKLVKFYKIQIELLWSAIEWNNWINVVCQLNSKFNSCTSTWTLKIFKIPRNFSKTFSEFFRVGARDRYRQILHYCDNEIITWPILSFFWWINKKNHLCACLR